MKMITLTKIGIAGVGGMITYLFGGFDKTLIVLCALIVTDYISGILKAIYKRELNSHIGFNGIIRKVAILIAVVLSNLMQYALGDNVPLREIVIMFYIANEGLSVIENLGTVIPVPDKFRAFFEQLNDKE